MATRFLVCAAVLALGALADAQSGSWDGGLDNEDPDPDPAPAPITGQCRGNTDAATNVACGAGFIPKPGDLAGTTVEACCDALPVAVEGEPPPPPPEVIYAYEATPWSVCASGCGPQVAKTRTVICLSATIYENGAVVRATVDTAECAFISAEPAATEDCPAGAVGSPCDDGNAETTGDQCESAETAVCTGKKVMASALTFDIDIAVVVLPTPATKEELAADPMANVEALKENPLAMAMKASLETTVRQTFAGADVVITGISAGSLVVDYIVELPADVVVDAAAKTGLVDAIVAAPLVEIPAEASANGEATTAPAPVVAPFKSYAYVRTSGTCPSGDCDASCGYAGHTEADVYTCTEESVEMTTHALCAGPLGHPTPTHVVCCPAADADTCVRDVAELQTLAEATVVPEPEPEVTVPETEPEPEVEEESSSPVAIIDAVVAVVLVVLVGAGVLCYCKKMCCFAEDGCASGCGDAEAEKRKVLEERLAHVRDQLPKDAENP